MKKKKIVKLAVIRSDSADPCPFGLTIPYSCQAVGELIYKMAPVNNNNLSKQDKEEIIETNNHMLRWGMPDRECPFARRLFEDRDVVECNWDPEADGALSGSPVFYRHFNEPGFDGLYSYPLGNYMDGSIDRGFYFGPYSIESAGSDQECKIKESLNNNEKPKK